MHHVVFLAPFLLLAAEEKERSIRPGETIEAALRPSDPVLEGRGPSKRFLLRAAADGPLTVSLESYDFDAFLRVEGVGGKDSAEDHDGGIGTNSQMLIPARKGARYRIIAASALKDGAGAFTLSVAAGEVLRAGGAAFSEASIVFRRKAAERAVARGDKKAAADHRLEEGERLADLSRFAEAKEAFEVSLALARDAKDRKMEAQALASLGYIHQYLGDLASSREVQEKALAILVGLGERELEARVRLNLGQLLGALGNYPGARTHIEKSLEIAGGLRDRGLEGNGLSMLAQLLIATGDHTGAREHLEKGLSLARAVSDRRLEGSFEGALGTVFLALRDFPRARDHYEKCLAIDRDLGNHHGVASTLGNVGMTYFYGGDYRRARKCYEESLSLARQTGSRFVERNALLNLANVDVALGDHRGALEQYEKALEAFPGERDLEATTKVNMAVAHLSLGEHALALALLEEALALHRELGNLSGELFALINLGKARAEVGDDSGAKAHYEKALDLAREQGDRLAEATILGNLGVIADMAGDFASGKELQERRIVLCREIGDRAGEATGLANLGVLHSSSGKGEEALACHEKALAIAREIGDRKEEARALGNMALGHTPHDRAKARRLAEEARAICVEIGMELSSLYPLRALALIALVERDLARARESLRDATAILERASAAGLEIADAAGLRSEHDQWELIAHDVTALRLDLAGADPEKLSAALSEGFREASRWKGRALLEGIAEHRGGGRTAGAIRIRRERKETLARRQSVLEKTSEAVRAGKPAGEIEALRAEARTLLAKADVLARGLRKASPRDADLDAPAGATPDAVRKAAVGEDTLLVEYAPGVERLHAYVLGAKSLDFLDLGDRKAVREQVESFRSLVAAAGAPGTPATIAEAGKKLHDLLLAPALERAGPGIERIVIVPAGALAALPFEALVTGVKGGKPGSFQDVEFVLDRYAVSYAPSSAVLAEVARLGARKEEGKMLVLADPVYPSESRGSPGAALASLRGVPAPRAFRRIAKTRNEALAIARLLVEKGDRGSSEALARIAKERSGSLSSKRIDLHLGAEASRERLAVDLRGYGVIHVAAHGYVDIENPQRTGIALAFGEEGGGYFTLADVLELDLDADIVVLSACETAGGAVKGGEGVESLARAFLYAGARGVVASLWQVSDRAAADTMKGFYGRAIAGKLSPSSALREAKLALRRARGPAPGGKRAAPPPEPGSKGIKKPVDRAAHPDHPFYWAPFIHVGLPR